MNVYLTKSFHKAYKKIIKKNPQLSSKIKEKIILFKSNPKHGSLRLHKLKGKRDNDWSFSIEKNIRIIASFGENYVLLVDIGTHDEVY